MTDTVAWERVLNLATGCHDYGGGYSNEHAKIFQHGIQTVVNVLTKAASGDESYQIRVVESIGREVREVECAKAEATADDHDDIDPGDRDGEHESALASAYGETDPPERMEE